MKKSLIAAALLFLLVVVFFSQIRLGALTALFMWDMLDGSTLNAPERGKLAWLTPAPAMKTVEIAGKHGKIDADLYYVEGRSPRAGLLLTHGIIEDGKNDPRLKRFAYSLARVGFTVLVPDLKGMKSFRIAFSDVDDIVASTHYLATLKDIVDPAKLGLMGFSYAAGPTMMAAAAPELRDHVKFVVSFGGYYDPIDVIRFITTGYFEYGREKGYLQPQPYGKWVFFQNNVDYVGNENDRKILREIFKNEQMETPANIAPLLKGLTSNGKYVYELLTNTDPNRTADLVQRIDPRLREYLQKLSMAPVVPAIRAHFIIGHGSTDPLIPYTESLRLADAVGDKSRVHVAILRLFTHVDPSQNQYSFKQYFTVYLPSALQFYSLIYDLLSQQT
ncbi:MAG TPA: prolyl oligopeptidase family serine peptidase [Candidatus Binatia bacterium]